MDKVLIIALVNFLLYVKTIGYHYVSDDIPVAQRPKHPNRWKQLLNVLNGEARGNIYFDRVLTILIHTSVAIAMYFAFGQNNVSFISALLFSVNPINNQGSVWLSGRGYNVPALLILLCMIFPYASIVFIWAACFFPLGYLFSSVLVFFNPVMALFLPIGWIAHRGEFFGRVKSKVSNEMYDNNKKIDFARLVIATKTIGWYFAHIIIPMKHTFYHSFMQSEAGSGRDKAKSIDIWFFIGVAMILSSIAYLILKPFTLMSFAIIWFYFSIAPFSNLIRMGQEIAERYAYVPCVAVMFLLATILAGQSPLLIAFVLGVYACKTFFWIEAYQSNYYLIEHSRIADKNAWFVWHLAGWLRWEADSHKEALRMWVKAVIIHPNESKVLWNIAVCLRILGKDDEAKQYFDRAIANAPKGQEAEWAEIAKEWERGKVAMRI